MSLRKPGWFFRAMILGAQGVFYNAFCESLSPYGHTGTDPAQISPVIPYLPSHMSPFCRASGGRGCYYLVSLHRDVFRLLLIVLQH